MKWYNESQLWSITQYYFNIKKNHDSDGQNNTNEIKS